MSSRDSANDPSSNQGQPPAENRSGQQPAAPETPSAMNGRDGNSQETATGETARDELSYYRNLLEELLHLFSHGDQEAVSRMISVIRSGASQSEIFNVMAELSEPFRQNGASSNDHPPSNSRLP